MRDIPGDEHLITLESVSLDYRMQFEPAIGAVHPEWSVPKGVVDTNCCLKSGLGRVLEGGVKEAAGTDAPADSDEVIPLGPKLPVSPLGPAPSPPPKAWNRMAYYHTPGVSIAVVNNFKIDWARGFGVREWGKRSPVTETTLFEAGSISKPIFALGVMKLVQERKLDLDNDVNEYLTSWKVPPNGPWQPRVTLRQLLSHSAGMTVHGFPGYLRTEKLSSVLEILDGRPLANTSRIEVNIVPGTQVRYSGASIFDWLGYALFCKTKPIRIGRSIPCSRTPRMGIGPWSQYPVCQFEAARAQNDAHLALNRQMKG